MINKIKKRPAKTGLQIDYSMTLRFFHYMATQGESQIIPDISDPLPNTSKEIRLIWCFVQ